MVKSHRLPPQLFDGDLNWTALKDSTSEKRTCFLLSVSECFVPRLCGRRKGNFALAQHRGMGTCFGGLLNAYIRISLAAFISKLVLARVSLLAGDRTQVEAQRRPQSLCFWNEKTGLDIFFPDGGFHTICGSPDDTGTRGYRGKTQNNNCDSFSLFSSLLILLTLLMMLHRKS